MHDTAMEFGRVFFETYVKEAQGRSIVDIGAQDVNGSLRSVAPPGCKYTGVDFAVGKGVDVVITDPYSLPFEENSFDVCVSSSCFEHSEFFWLLFNEIIRILKPNGVLYINVPSNGGVHRFPVDCWRFYPDSGMALQNWGRRSGYKTILLESFTGKQKGDAWNDFIAVFLKDERCAQDYSGRMRESVPGHTNGFVYGSPVVSNPSEWQEDQKGHLNRLFRKDQMRRWIKAWIKAKIGRVLGRAE
jgi:SAM-dependent methyltransferase